jgi:ATP-binding cassette subfamily F protein uup
LLEEALVAFDGSVVVVSHDRYFLNRVCASILAFEGDGVVRYSIGDYNYYLEKRAERLASSAAPPTTASSATDSERLITAQRPRKLKWSERQELETIEDKILAAEEDVVRLEAQFADPDFYTKHGQHWQMFDAQLRTARDNVSQLYSRWEELERIRAER